LGVVKKQERDEQRNKAELNRENFKRMLKECPELNSSSRFYESTSMFK
jgi:hypothetical protein